MEKIRFTAWFDVNPTFSSKGIVILIHDGLITPHPSCALSVNDSI